MKVKHGTGLTGTLPFIILRLEKIDWEEMYALTDINLINNFFESKVLEVLNKMAPMRTFQNRRKDKSWVSRM